MKQLLHCSEDGYTNENIGKFHVKNMSSEYFVSIYISQLSLWIIQIECSIHGVNS